MGVQKGPTECGSGGKKGHSNMAHWDLTEIVKKDARHRRRINDGEEAHTGVKDYKNEKDIK